MTSTKIQCRLCAQFKDSSELIDVKNDEAVQIGLEHKILLCLNLTFTDDVFLPRSVCFYCCEKVSSSYEFKEQVQKAQELLKPCFFEDDDKSVKSEYSANDAAFDYVESLIKEDLGDSLDDDLCAKDEDISNGT